LFLFLIAIFFSRGLYAQPQSLNISTPSIDGKITESEWSDAKVFSNFYVTIPKTDEKFYDSTRVYIKQTKDALWFAIKYWPKGKVISKSLIRDQSTEEENEFFILLDLENKRQNGYIFVFSFLNNQRDMQVYNVNNKVSNWDWVWYCKSTIYKEAKNGEPGYIESEIKIPVDKLQNKNQKQIGIDMQLFSYKPDGSYYYYNLIPNAELLSLKNLYTYDLKFPFEERLNISFNATPYLVANRFNDSSYKGNFGGEFNLSLDKHKLKTTINTDESTLEADPFRFSFYNRAIFLSEKRTFFSKDLDIYSSPINLFYTRSIENIDYGFNYTYRSDKLKTGAIYVQSDPEADGNKNRYFIARPRFYSDDFNVGGMFVHSDHTADQYKENIASFDGFYRFPFNRVRLGVQYAKSFNEYAGVSKQGDSYNLYGYYQSNDAGGPYADWGYYRVNKDFQASTAFTGVTGNPDNFDQINLSGGYKWVFNRNYFSDFSLSGSYYKDRQLEDNFINQENYGANLNFKLNGYIRMNANFNINRPNDFDENGNLIVRENMSQEYNANFIFGNNGGYVGYYFGPYYGSFIKNPYFGMNFILFDKFAVNGSVNFLEYFDVKQTIINARFDYRVFDKFFIRSFYRKDNYTRQSLLNTLFQYEFFAGSNIYFVLNLSGEKLQNTSRYFKIGYEFNF
jgi:hypothetical protein